MHRSTPLPAAIPVNVTVHPSGSRSAARLTSVGETRARLVGPLAEGPIYIEIPKVRGRRGRVAMLATVRWRDGDQAEVSIDGMLPHHRERWRDLLVESGSAR